MCSLIVHRGHALRPIDRFVTTIHILKSVKASLRDPESLKEAFMDLRVSLAGGSKGPLIRPSAPEEKRPSGFVRE
ncbi:hypothetical protein CVV72_36765 [Amycolatopsis sp. TNS106]|nr:hypothetical protein CVV72_36765 [Amycolatopsis sp. TNS106]